MTTEPMTADRALQILGGARECLRFGPKGYVSIGGELEKARAFFAAMALRERAHIKVLHEARRAIGDHDAPSDCYATGPLTGDTFRDLVECPACSFISMFDALKLPEPQP